MSRQSPSSHLLAAGAALLACGLLACSAGPGLPVDMDTTPPAVAITDDVALAKAVGPVRFTFTFSEDVGTSFQDADVAVSGGAAGTLARVSATVYQLVVTPPAASAGTVAVDVAAGAFSDAAGNTSTLAARATQDFDTRPAPPSGTVLLTFDDSAVTYGLTDFGGVTSVRTADSTLPGNQVVRITKPLTAELWAGVTLSTGPNQSIVRVPLTASEARMTLRVRAPAAGVPMRLKLEDAADATHTVETEAIVSAAATWETLTFNFANQASGTAALNPAFTFNKVSVFPHFGKTGTQLGAATVYEVDDLTFLGVIDAGAGGGAGGGGGGDADAGPPTDGGPCLAPDCVDFSASGIGFGPFENGGGGSVALAMDPAVASNQVVKFVKKAGDGEYFGTTITGLGVKAVLTDAARTVTMRAYSSAPNTNFLLKFEGGAGAAPTTEKDVVLAQAGVWQTLSFLLPNAGTYPTVVVFPGGRSTVTAERVMYVDDLRFPATVPASGTGDGGLQNGVFADDYTGDLFVNARSTQGGNVGFVFDARLQSTKDYDYAGVSGTAQNPGGVPNFYFGFGLNAPAITDAWFTAFVGSPGNAAVNVSGFTNIKVNVWGPDQLFKAGVFPTLTVMLQGPAVAGCTSRSGGSEVRRTFTTTTQGAASVYTLPLSSFTLGQACSGETTVAQVLASIRQVNIVLENTNIQYTNKDPGGRAFTNGLNLGSITFN